MKQVFLLASLAVLLTACQRPADPPEDIELTAPPTAAKLDKIDPPGGIQMSSATMDVACQVGAKTNLQPGSSKPADPGKGGGGNKQLSIHDQPPDGGDGSFRLNLGELGCTIQDGNKSIQATHSHRERHYLWYIDMPDANKGSLTYVQKYILLDPDHKIEIALEQKYGIFKNWLQKGVVTMQQERLPQYKTNCLKGHPTSCTEDGDYVWAVRSSGLVGLFPKKVNDTLVLDAWTFPFSNSQRMRKMTITTPGDPANNLPPKVKVIEFRSGCAAFQVCGRYNECMPLQPKCPYVSVSAPQQLTW